MGAVKQPAGKDGQQIRDLVNQLLEEARAMERADRRAEVRLPFFAPVDVKLANGPVTNLSAFSREISASGIGLLHSVPLKPETVTIHIKGPTGTQHAVRTDIVWCKPCGEGWYLSGGEFRELV